MTSVFIIAALVRPSDAIAQTIAPQPPDDSLVEIQRNVPFGGTLAEPLTLNVYAPTMRTTGRPAVVLVHGGSWTQGGPDDMEREGKLLAQQGWVGFSISYRLAVADHPSWPSNLEDVRTAVRWVGAHASDYGADPTRIALIGNSAGGHLAALVGVTGFGQDTQAVDGKKAPRVRVIATFSAPLALERLVPSGDEPPSSCGDDKACQIFWRLPLVPGMLGCEPSACPDKYTAASPVWQVTSSTPPMFLANATKEIVPIDQLDAMADALGKHGVPLRVQRLDSEKHGTEYTPKVWNDMMPFLANRLGVPEPQPIAFAEDRELRDYVLFVFIGLFSVGLLVLFVVTAVRHKWDEPA